MFGKRRARKRRDSELVSPKPKKTWLWLLFLVPGWIAWCLISLWFLYRIVKGMVRMNADRPMDNSHVI